MNEHIHTVKYGSKTIHIVGTAHISKQSVEEVRSVIDRVQPDTVCVELDKNRYQAMMDPNRWRKLNVFEVIKQRKGLQLLLNIIIGSFQRRIGQRFGIEPGAEFKAAIEAAEAQQAALELVDRDIQITFKRTWRKLGFAKKLTVLSLILDSLFEGEELTEAEVEAMKASDQLTELMRQFAEKMPSVQETLIDERDQYMMHAIRNAPGETIVAVVGAGHVQGMLNYLEADLEPETLNLVPRGTNWTTMAQWLIPALFLYAIYNGYQQASGQTVVEMMSGWVLPNALFSALLTAIAGGRVLSVVAAAFASPLTSLVPLVGTGFFVGYLEAKLRKPTVEDCERIPEDAVDLPGIYRNRFTRVLLVFFMSNLGSSLGAIIGISWVISLLNL